MEKKRKDGPYSEAHEMNIHDRIYDRSLPNPKPYPRPSSRLKYRFETLVGVTGAKMAKFRASWKDTSVIWFDLVWRPHVIGILLFEVRLPAAYGAVFL